MSSARGVSWRLVPFERIDDLRQEIESRLNDGLIDRSLHKEYLAHWSFSPPEGMPHPESLAIAAVPQPALRVTFRGGGRVIKAVVPPTYFDAAEASDLAVREMRKALGEGHSFIRALLPLKLLACRSGLAFYGRNNIAYVPGCGSFCRLTAFYTDAEPGGSTWQEPKVLPECEGCRLCVAACPAKVMVSGRFAAKAEICLTYLNEKPAGVPFPEWVSPSWHNAVVGCMICQRVCPANREVVGWVEDRGDFSEEETEYLLRGDFSCKAEAGKAEEKLKALGLDLSIFPRNLKTLMRS